MTATKEPTVDSFIKYIRDELQSVGMDMQVSEEVHDALTRGTPQGQEIVARASRAMMDLIRWIDGKEVKVTDTGKKVGLLGGFVPGVADLRANENAQVLYRMVRAIDEFEVAMNNALEASARFRRSASVTWDVALSSLLAWETRPQDRELCNTAMHIANKVAELRDSLEAVHGMFKRRYEG